MPLRITLKSTPPVLNKWSSRDRTAVYLFATWFPKYLQLIARTYFPEKHSFQILRNTHKTPGHPGAPADANKINAAFRPANIAVHYEGVMSSIQAYYLSYAFIRRELPWIPLMDVGDVNWEPAGKDLPF